MKKKSEKAREFIDYLGEVYDACGYIHEMGGCDKCPIKHNCLDETTVTEFANFCTKGAVKEMLDFADDVENYISEEDYIYDLADRQRKGERDELYD